jgi:inner membrane transporter RhtA
MEHVAPARWARAPSPRPHTSSPPPEDGPRAASHLGGPLLVLASSASLQSSAALATTVFAVFGPVGTGALRFAFASPVLLLVARPALRRRTRDFWLTAVALGVTLPSLSITLYEAISRLPLGAVVTLQFLGPLALALAGARRRLDLAWAAAAGAGVGLITGGPSASSTVGVLLALGAAALTMATLTLSRRLATVSSGLDGIAVAVTVGAVVTLPLAVPAALATHAPHELALVAAVATLGLAVPYALEYLAIRTVSVRTFSVLLSLDPAIAALAGVLWLGQRFGASEIGGIGLVVVASAGAMATRRSS